MPPKPFIVFVYNADSGLFNTASDIAHKIFSPDTYSCNLCSITHGNFSMRSEWKEYLESFDADFEFLHRNELADKYGVTDITLPVVLIKKDETLEELISTQELNQCNSLDDLKLLVTRSLVAYNKQVTGNHFKNG